MWCPKCRSEYREGFAVCSECGTALVAELKKDEPVFEPVFLTTTDAENAWEVQELLQRTGVVSYLESTAGEFVRVDPEQEIPGDIYVNRKDLPMAKRCLMLLSRPPLPIEEEDLMEAYEEYMNQEGVEEAQSETEADSDNAAWKVFLILGLVAVGCVLAAIFLI
ncbi:MAG: zinc ribbon domain-containing protein [Ruminococcaceae bacterium]|nr:zinc ribbon domain-containing protein [Oscillospiraceae bacterium]